MPGVLDSTWSRLFRIGQSSLDRGSGMKGDRVEKKRAETAVLLVVPALGERSVGVDLHAVELDLEHQCSGAGEVPTVRPVGRLVRGPVPILEARVVDLRVAVLVELVVPDDPSHLGV